MLKIESLEVFYDLFKVIHGVDLYVDRGEIVAILGGNGAGKSSLLRVISGLIRPTAGEISFDHERIDDIPPHKIVEKGIIQIPEGRKLFPSLTVLENLYLGSAFDWEWDSTANRLRFEDMRIKSDTYKYSAIYFAGAIVLNHLASAIDAAKHSRKNEKIQTGVIFNQYGNPMLTIRKEF